jgi:rhamnosyltransferase
MNKIGLIVPTLNAGQRWRHWLDALAAQTRKPDVLLLIDSSSTDDTVALAKLHGFEVRIISRAEFNHGATRQWGVSLLPAEVDLIVFLTQDALLADPRAIEHLADTFADERVGAAYGRQLPHVDAGPIGAHARLFNYPAENQTRALEDRQSYGIKTAFISNSFAGYRRAALAAVGGFPGDVIMNEDTFVAGRMLLTGWKIAYRADAEVHHSHDYGFGEEFRRYFDIGVFHARNPWLRERFGEVDGEGRRYVLSELVYLARRAFWLIPSALLRNGLKWLGYKLGSRWHRELPVAVRKRFSLHAAYWNRA